MGQLRQSLGRNDQWAVQARFDPTPCPLENQGGTGTATLEWVAWFNHHRLLGSIGYIPAAEAEANYYRQLAGKNETEVST